MMVKEKFSAAGGKKPVLQEINTTGESDNQKSNPVNVEELSDISIKISASVEEFHASQNIVDSIQSSARENIKNLSSTDKNHSCPEGNQTCSPLGCDTEKGQDDSSLGSAMPDVDSSNENLSHCESTNNHMQKNMEVGNNSKSDCGVLTLVDCSVTCLPVYNGPNPPCYRFTSRPQTSSISYSQQTNSNHSIPRSTAGLTHLRNALLATSGTTSSSSVEGNVTHKSTYHGVTRHKWTGKFEAHLWDKTSTEGRRRKGKQVYLGGYETAEDAARAYDLAALKFWGSDASPKLNFPILNYEKQLEEMESMSREELVTFLRRQSISFTRGSSMYRGVTRNREGNWQARIKVPSYKKDIYLGTFRSEEEAARAYDMAAIHLKGVNALTNFDISDYLQGDSDEPGSFPQPKRARRSSESLAFTLPAESGSNLAGIIPLPESARNKTSALLPEHPTAVLPN